jgi:hypothetical protein
MRTGWIVAALLFSPALAAADKPCSRADAANAQKSLDRAATWPQMQKAWQDFQHCDNGATEEQFTDALMRMLIDWKSLDALAAAMQKDPQFKAFVVAHLRSPGAKDDLEDVYARAKSRCPKGLDEFCGELADIARPKK